jgi:hypothetical protein
MVNHVMQVRRTLFRFIASAVLSLGMVSPTLASYVYSLDVQNTTVGDFTLTVPNLITTNTSFQFSDFDVINPYVGSIRVDFADLLGTSYPNDPYPHVWYAFPDDSLNGFYWVTPFTSVGIYCAGVIGCDNTQAIMTIREAGDVPEPATLALIGLGLAGLAASRRRNPS